MTVFVDSSALVKLYVPEYGHQEIRLLPSPLIVSELARVEVPAAFWRKHRIGELDAGDAGILTQAFEVDFHGNDGGRFAQIAVTPVLLDEAARLVAVHPLRASDSVQLASALHTQRALATAVPFAAFDQGLRSAAATEGMPLQPPQL